MHTDEAESTAPGSGTSTPPYGHRLIIQLTPRVHAAVRCTHSYIPGHAPGPRVGLPTQAWDILAMIAIATQRSRIWHPLEPASDTMERHILASDPPQTSPS